MSKIVRVTDGVRTMRVPRVFSLDGYANGIEGTLWLEPGGVFHWDAATNAWVAEPQWSLGEAPPEPMPALDLADDATCLDVVDAIDATFPKCDASGNPVESESSLPIPEVVEDEAQKPKTRHGREPETGGRFAWDRAND